MFGDFDFFVNDYDVVSSPITSPTQDFEIADSNRSISIDFNLDNFTAPSFNLMDDMSFFDCNQMKIMENQKLVENPKFNPKENRVYAPKPSLPLKAKIPKKHVASFQPFLSLASVELTVKSLREHYSYN